MNMKHLSSNLESPLFARIFHLLCFLATLLTAGAAFGTPSNSVVISQIFGGGGLGSSSLKNDFVELHNITGSAVSINGWSVQYASVTNTGTWANKIDLSGSIPAGAYLLVKLGSGGDAGAELPPAAFTSTLNISSVTGKVALVNSTTFLSGSNPQAQPSVVDFVGYGTMATAFETALAPAPSATRSISRRHFGTIDSDNNSTDLVVTWPAPRNSASQAHHPAIDRFLGVPSTASPHQEFAGVLTDEADYFAGTDFALDRHSVTFFPDGSGGYTYVVQPITRFPVDMSQESDFDTSTFNLGTFPFRGIPQSSFEIENGNITFGDPSLGMISVLQGGGWCIRKLETAEKMVLYFDQGTWESDREEDIVTKSGYFEAELFYDGRIRISYIGTAFDNGLVGIASSSDPYPPTEEDFKKVQMIPLGNGGLESDGSLPIRVKLNQALPHDVSFGWSCQGMGAATGVDFTAPGGVVTIPALATSAIFQVPIIDDSLPEPGEAFLVRISHPSNPDWIYGECEAWIIDNEAPPSAAGSLADAAPRIRQAGAKVYIEAGGSGVARFRIVSIQGGSLADPTTGSSFGPGSEITLAQGLQGLLCGGAGLSFTVESLNAQGNRLGLASFDVDGLSTDTVFGFENVAIGVIEGQMATLTVRADGPGQTVAYEILPGTATPFNGTSGDYLPELVPLRFHEGLAVIEIPVFADELAEGSENFSVRLVGAGQGSLLGPDSLARVTISDGAGPIRPPLALSAAAPTAVDDPFWSGDEEDGALGYLIGYPGNIAPVLSNGPWINIPIAEQSGRFTVSFEITTSADPVDCVVALSENPSAAYTDNSALVRAAPDGIWDAYDDDSYEHDATLDYNSATNYKVTMRVDVPAGRYDVSIQTEIVDEDGREMFGDPVTILSQGEFRRSAPTLRYLTMKAQAGATTVSRIKVTRNSLSLPFQKQSGSFSLGFDLRMSGDAEYNDILFGLSGSSSLTEAGMSAILALINDSDEVGPWYAWDGMAGEYVNASRGYHRGNTCHVEFQVNVPAGTYTVTVESLLRQDSEPVVLGPFKFRASTTGITYLHVVSDKVAFKLSKLNTPPRAATAPNAGNTNADWINIPFPRQTGKFSISYELSTSASPIDAIGGLSATTAYDWVDVSAICRANPTGSWDGRNGTAWATLAALPYAAGTWYKVTIDADVGTDTYNLTVTPEGGSPVRLLTQAAFRKAATELRYLTLRSVTGSLAVRNISEPTAHPADDTKQSVGRIHSTLGKGSGVAVADHAVLTSARLVFNPDTLFFSPAVSWHFRYRTNSPISAWLVTGYAAGALGGNAQGTVASDSVDVAILSFRPLKVPELDNLPALGGYTGFLIDPTPTGGSNPWLGTGTSRFMSYLPAAETSFAHQADLLQTNATSLGFTHQGRGVYSCSGISPVAGTRGAPLFSLAANGRYYPSAICLGEGAGTARFRVVDGLVAHTIYRANLVQQLYDPGVAILLGGREWEAEAIDPSVLATYGVISAQNLPAAAVWELSADYWSNNQEHFRRSSGQKAIEVLSGIYQVKLLPLEGYTISGSSEFSVGISAGQIFRIPAKYRAAPATTYQGWVKQTYTAVQQEDTVAMAAAAPTLLGVENLMAYAFGASPKAMVFGYAAPQAQPPRPGLPVIKVEPTTPRPSFKIDYLQRVATDLTYTVEFSDNISSGWTASPVAPTLTALASTAEWKHASLTFMPPASSTGMKFARVKVTLNP